MDLDWQRLGYAIRRARMAKGLSQVELAMTAGVAKATIQNFERGRESVRVPPTLARVERAIGWAEGSAESVLKGGEPLTAEPVGDGVVIVRTPENEVRDAVASAAIAVSDGMTAREIRELSDRILGELKDRGLL